MREVRIRHPHEDQRWSCRHNRRRSGILSPLFAAVEDFELEAKSRVRSHHATQLLPGDGFAVDDQQGPLLEAVGIVGDLPADHIILGNLIATAFWLDVPATKLPSDTLKERLEGDEQVLFRVGDHREFVALVCFYLQGFERQLVAEDMGTELEGVGHAVEVLEGQRIERDMVVVESEVLGHGLVVTPRAHKLCPLLVPDRYPVVGGNIGSAGAAYLLAHRLVVKKLIPIDISTC